MARSEAFGFPIVEERNVPTLPGQAFPVESRRTDPDLSDFALLSEMRGAMRALSTTRGSHTQVYAFESARLGELLQEWAGRLGADHEARERVRRYAEGIARRFLLKIGNIQEYVIKLSGGRESLIRRSLMSETFGPVGYNLAPSRDKARLDAREAVREIPYFAFGPSEDQFAPDILEDLRRLRQGPVRARPPDPPPFLIEEGREGRRALDVYRILQDDPYFLPRIHGFDDLERFQRFLREQPLDAVLRERLAAFFEAPMTVGVRDVLRWLQGSRHPDLGWKTAEQVIRTCFDRFGTESFLPPEVNYYTVSIHRSREEVSGLADANQAAAHAFASLLVARAPLTWTARLTDAELEEIAEAILEIHHDYPIYRVEPYTGVFSTSGLRLAGRVALNTLAHLTRLELPDRRNLLGPDVAGRERALHAFVEGLPERDRGEFFDLVNRLLFEAAVLGGIPDGRGGLFPYTRIDRTFYSFQERAQYPLERDGRVLEMVTLEDLLDPKGRSLLDRHPDIAERLVVFFVLVYRYFLDTGHVADLRPDDAGRDLFLKGIWGYKTRNLIVVTGRDAHGNPRVCIRFVDNKDQFKQYRRVEDRAQPLGLAKYGLRLIHPLIQPAMERSIGLFTDLAASAQAVKPAARADRVTRFTRSLNHLLREGVSAALTHTEAFLNDLIDDSTEGLDRLMRRD